MKKFTFVAALFAAFSISTFAQTVTNVGEEGENNTFEVPAGYDVYAIYLGDETRAKLGVDDDHYIYIGSTDIEGERPYYVWDATFQWADPVSGDKGEGDYNSFGVLGDNIKLFSVGGWSGGGINVKKGFPIDLSAIDEEYNLHIGVRAPQVLVNNQGKPVGNDGNPADYEMYITDGNGTEAHFKLIDLGVEPGDDWYSIDFTGEELLDLYELDFTTAKAYEDKNLFCILFGPSGNILQYDSVFFYGPHKEKTGIQTVNVNDNANANVLYNLAGQRVSKNAKGLLIKNGKKFINM